VAWLAKIGIIGLRADGRPSIEGIPVSIIWWIGLTLIACLHTVAHPLRKIWTLRLRWRCQRSAQCRRAGSPAPKSPSSSAPRSPPPCSQRSQVLTAGSADTLRGTQKEFEAIIAAVIGGTLLTGGYGSAIGALFGSFIFGFVQMGIFYTGVDTDWFKLFMGLMMVIAVLFNSTCFAAPLETSE
jgi:simple sugar transport system permease protein